MTSINELISLLGKWSSPREAVHRGQKCPFLLSCHLSLNDVQRCMLPGIDAGPDLQAFWNVSNGADLFKDDAYGQWGLRIVRPCEVDRITSRERELQSSDMLETDLVIGEFYGDSELLIVDTSGAAEGKFPVFVKLPMDERSEWPKVGDSFRDFLENYVSAQGEKFWEAQRGLQ